MSLTVKVAKARANGRGMPGVGDPGFFGAIGSLVSKVASVAKIIPGPIGWAATAAQKLLGPRMQPGTQVRNPRDPGPTVPQIQPGWQPMPDFGPQVQKPGIIPAIQAFLPGGETGMMPAPPVGAPSGYHVNKSDYFLKDGTFIPVGSRWVRNRHRNPLNPRAASKAISRIESLKRATSRFSRITIRKKCKT